MLINIDFEVICIRDSAHMMKNCANDVIHGKKPSFTCISVLKSSKGMVKSKNILQKYQTYGGHYQTL